MRTTSLPLAWAALALTPAAAWAHGDHHGIAGALHLLANPDHLVALLAAAGVAAVVGRQLRRRLRRAASEPAPRTERRGGTA